MAAEPANVAAPQARRELEMLAEAHLVIRIAIDRFALYDLKTQT